MRTPNILLYFQYSLHFISPYKYFYQQTHDLFEWIIKQWLVTDLKFGTHINVRMMIWTFVTMDK